MVLSGRKLAGKELSSAEVSQRSRHQKGLHAGFSFPDLPSGLRDDDSRKLEWGEKIRFLPILGIRGMPDTPSGSARRAGAERLEIRCSFLSY